MSVFKWWTMHGRPTVELKYYPFMISLDKYNRISNVFSPKLCVRKKT